MDVRSFTIQQYTYTAAVDIKHQSIKLVWTVTSTSVAIRIQECQENKMDDDKEINLRNSTKKRTFKHI